MASFQLLRDRLRDLPVHRLIDDVVRDVLRATVTIVTAATSSGKSMLLPSALADASDHQIVVLVPRRFLALDAAYNVAELAGMTVGEEVGYALGQMESESSLRSAETKVLYCTYGYALSSGLINRARTIVLDEVHEGDEYISLSRAILRERKRSDPLIRLLEMSATIDGRAQAKFWQGLAQTAVHAIAGVSLLCDLVHESTMLAGQQDRTIEEIALDLLAHERSGIAVFRPGVKEVEASVERILVLCAQHMPGQVDVVGIHGGTPSDQRRLARQAPGEGRRKIIVGTNVIESGINLRWLDAAVSDGYRKTPYHRMDSGADALVKEDQPQSGLLQQIGRINRDPIATGFERGLYILHAKKPIEVRRLQNGPAIARQSLNSVAFHAACLGYDPSLLTWDLTTASDLSDLPGRMKQAKTELMRLQLINEDWSLTKEGAFIKHLPVSPEVGAMLCEAKKIDDVRLREHGKRARVMRDVVIIASIVESHGLRRDTKKGHKGDQYRSSDMLDAMNAFRFVRDHPLSQPVIDATENFIAQASEQQLLELHQQRLDLDALCAKHNVRLTGFVEVARLADEIVNRLKLRDNGVHAGPREEEDKYDAERYGEIQRCILNGHANRLFLQENGALRDLLRDFAHARRDCGEPFNGYGLSHSSIVAAPKDGALLVGSLREVQSALPQGQCPLLVLTEATAIPADIFLSWLEGRALQHQPIVSDTALEGGIFSARYAGAACFEIALTPAAQMSAKRLI